MCVGEGHFGIWGAGILVYRQYLFLKKNFIFPWIINFQASPGHCLYALGLPGLYAIFFWLLQLNKRTFFFF